MILRTFFQSFHVGCVPRCCPVLLFCILTSINLTAQDKKTVITTSGSGIALTTYQEIPAATEPCAPLECEWWSRLQQAGNKLLRKGDQKATNAFVSIFVEGIEKSYKIPVKDRPALTLVFGPRVQTDNLASKEKNGTVKLSIELRSDASVGEVRVLNGLGSKIDQRCIQSAQRIIFLPAVRDRNFVTEWQTPEYKFFHAH